MQVILIMWKKYFPIHNAKNAMERKLKREVGQYDYR